MEYSKTPFEGTNGQTVSNGGLSNVKHKQTNERDTASPTEMILPDLFIGIFAPQSRICQWYYTPVTDEIEEWAKRYLLPPIIKVKPIPVYVKWLNRHVLIFTLIPT